MTPDLHAELAGLFSQWKGVMKVAVGYSGGMDSTVLLHAVTKVVSSFQIRVFAIHVQHSLREKQELQKEQELIKKETAFLNVPLHLRKINADEYKSLAKVHGMEAAMRMCRYRCFYDVLLEQEISHVLMGHHADDQAETMLLRLLAGNFFSLGGIPSHREWKNVTFHRPLMNFSRKQLIQYAQQHKLSWSDDISNAETRYPRNFFRHKVLPVLEQRFPSFHKQMVRNMHTWEELSVWVDAQLPKWEVEKPDRLRIPFSPFFSLPPSLRLRCLYQGLRHITDHTSQYHRVPAAFFKPLCLSVQETEGDMLVGRGWRFFMQDNHLIWKRLEERTEKGYFFYCMGTHWGLTISPLSSIINPVLNGEECSFPIWGSVIVRTLRAGDYIRKDNHYSSVRKKMMRQGLTSWQRQRVPVVEDQRGVVAVLVNLFGRIPMIRELSSVGEEVGRRVSVSVIWSKS